MRCPSCAHENENMAAVCAECLRPLELPALEDRALREPAEPAGRLPPPGTQFSFGPNTVRVVAPEPRRFMWSSPPDLRGPRALHAVAPSISAPPANVPRLPRAPAPAVTAAPAPVELPPVREQPLREPAGAPPRVPRVTAQPTQRLRAPATLGAAAPSAMADTGQLVPQILRPRTARLVHEPAVARPSAVPPLPTVVEPALQEPARQPVQPSPLLARACQRASQLLRVVPRPVRSLLSPPPGITRPAPVKAHPPLPPARPSAVPALPAMAEPALQEPARQPVQPSPLLARASQSAAQLLHIVPGPVRSLLSPPPGITRPAPVKAHPPPPPARPSAVPALPPAVEPALQEWAGRAARPGPMGRAPHVAPSPTAAAGGVRSIPPIAAAAISPPAPEARLATRDQSVALPARARPAAVPSLPRPRPAVRRLPRPAPVRAPSLVPPMRLRPSQMVAILSVLVVSIATITGYYIGRPLFAGGQGETVDAGAASMAMMGDHPEGAYAAVVRDIWGSATVALRSFHAAVAERNLRKIAGAARDLRIRFDVLAIDARYLEPPAEMEHVHQSLLTAIDRSSAMFDRADALAANALDEDTAIRNAELLSAAAKQARAAYESVQAESDGLALALSASVWSDVEAIAEIADEQRRRESERRQASTSRWEPDTDAWRR